MRAGRGKPPNFFSAPPSPSSTAHTCALASLPGFSRIPPPPPAQRFLFVSSFFVRWLCLLALLCFRVPLSSSAHERRKNLFPFPALYLGFEDDDDDDDECCFGEPLGARKGLDRERRRERPTGVIRVGVFEEKRREIIISKGATVCREGQNGLQNVLSRKANFPRPRQASCPSAGGHGLLLRASRCVQLRRKKQRQLGAARKEKPFRRAFTRFFFAPLANVDRLLPVPRHAFAARAPCPPSP